jgi:nitroimidazol reductase NimA-like FMN-containing flavoprotein (pyridoxamine 5'-phosphate oxidase superfamily)
VSAGILEVLTADECRQLLRGTEVGRVVFCDVRGPVALPVNYLVDRDDIVFRTSASSSILSSSYTHGVSFEVDAIDVARHEGWSVLATGDVVQVKDPAVAQHVRMLGVTPWAHGPRDEYLQLHVRSLTGRRIVAP